MDISRFLNVSEPPRSEETTIRSSTLVPPVLSPKKPTEVIILDPIEIPLSPAKEDLKIVNNDKINSPSKPYFSIRAGRLVVDEKKLPLDRHPQTIQEISEFHKFFQEEFRICVEKELPVKFDPLIAKLVQDASGDLAHVAQFIASTIRPVILEEEFDDERTSDLSESFHLLRLVKEAILRIAERKNYGSNARYQSYWKWEVKDLSLLPKEYTAIVSRRRQRRLEAQLLCFEDSRDTSNPSIPQSAPDQSLSVVSEVVNPVPTKDVEEIQLPTVLSVIESTNVMSSPGRSNSDKEKKPTLAKPRKKIDKEKDKENVALKDDKAEPISAQKQIAAFFSTLHRKSVVEAEEKMTPFSQFDELFPPLFLMPHTKLAKLPKPQSFSCAGFEGCFKNENAVFNRESLISAWRSRKRKHFKLMRLPSSKLAGLNVTTQVKFLSFCENHRPAYFGTFGTKSKLISGRRPFGKEPTWNYEFDSDEEWEDEEDGESLKDSEIDDDEDGSLSDEEEDDWLVPEGYLSADEGVDEDDSMGRESGKKEVISKEIRRAPLKPLVPVVIGIDFEAADEVLQAFAVVPVLLDEEPQPVDNSKPTQTRSRHRGKSSSTLTIEMREELLSTVLGSHASLPNLVKEFKAKHPDLLKSNIEFVINNFAEKIRPPGHTRRIWVRRETTLSEQHKDSVRDSPPAGSDNLNTNNLPNSIEETKQDSPAPVVPVEIVKQQTSAPVVPVEIVKKKSPIAFIRMHINSKLVPTPPKPEKFLRAMKGFDEYVENQGEWPSVVQFYLEAVSSAWNMTGFSIDLATLTLPLIGRVLEKELIVEERHLKFWIDCFIESLLSVMFLARDKANQHREALLYLLKIWSTKEFSFPILLLDRLFWYTHEMNKSQNTVLDYVCLVVLDIIHVLVSKKSDLFMGLRLDIQKNVLPACMQFVSAIGDSISSNMKDVSFAASSFAGKSPQSYDIDDHYLNSQRIKSSPILVSEERLFPGSILNMKNWSLFEHSVAVAFFETFFKEAIYPQ